MIPQFISTYDLLIRRKNARSNALRPLFLLFHRIQFFITPFVILTVNYKTIESESGPRGGFFVESNFEQLLRNVIKIKG